MGKTRKLTDSVEYFVSATCVECQHNRRGADAFMYGPHHSSSKQLVGLCFAKAVWKRIDSKAVGVFYTHPSKKNAEEQLIGFVRVEDKAKFVKFMRAVNNLEDSMERNGLGAPSVFIWLQAADVERRENDAWLRSFKFKVGVYGVVDGR